MSEINQPTIHDMPLQSQLDVEYLCDYSIELLSEFPKFQTPKGMRMNASFNSGKIVGPRLNGEFIAGGDWITQGNDRISHIDVRATIRTDDGEYIYLTNIGKMVFSPEPYSRFLNGEHVRYNEFYGRSSPVFETGAEKYAWLNGVVTVAFQELCGNRVDIRVYVVK
ncbi:MAG: DUF3237 domain-containing protein [Methyloligellaceae bacterium]